MSLSKPETERLTVVIVGAGLVGCIQAIYLTKRGQHVTIYEQLEDPRTWSEERARSINLTMSPRGQTALREIGLEDQIVRSGVLAKGRVVHDGKGNRTHSLYNEKGEGIVSLKRTKLNAFLVEEAITTYNIPIHFEHSFEKCDATPGDPEGQETCVFRNKDGEQVTVKADLVIGTDGAHSAVRQEMFNRKKLNFFKQEYHDHWYTELVVRAGADGKHQMEPDMLHIWPREQFMLITFPNQNGTFSGTLFMPAEKFDEILGSKEVLVRFFNAEFPDLVRLVGEDYLRKHFFGEDGHTVKRPGRLISNEVRPYHSGRSILLLGDAAHAMVPFLGQGMNSGFEDCWILDKIFQKHGYSIETLGLVLDEFSNQRCEEGKAISEMAFEHYVELRSDIAGFSFYVRKFLDNMLFRVFPDKWVPQYTMVAFTNKPYSECRLEVERQKRVITWTLISVGLAFLVTLLAIFLKWCVWP
ncbi:unnamed protein product [Lymnaea stagnalis]|uniref:FAD-binding domain-containing protein n=1 Tax=Lymnaea stagnalis TaxID=6523 RepID=A0AAV2IAC5_LYMST